MEKQLVSILYLVSLTTTPQAADHHCLPTNAMLEEKLNRNADFNDHNHDGLVTSSDIAYDLRLYDSNHDGVVTEGEMLKRYLCVFGDTVYFARFNFNQLSQGRANVSTNHFSGEPFASGLPRSQFIAVNRGRYQLFESLKRVNVDMDLDEKLAINAQHNDHDNNRLVTFDDIAYDLSHNFDTNHDGKVTQFEWVVGWICAYGDSGDFARFVWNQIRKGADSIQASQFSGAPFDTGIPLDAFKAKNRNRYVEWAAQNSGVIG